MTVDSFSFVFSDSFLDLSSLLSYSYLHQDSRDQLAFCCCCCCADLPFPAPLLQSSLQRETTNIKIKLDVESTPKSRLRHYLSDYRRQKENIKKFGPKRTADGCERRLLDRRPYSHSEESKAAKQNHKVAMDGVVQGIMRKKRRCDDAVNRSPPGNKYHITDAGSRIP